MKGSVPGTAKISKDAKECVQECVSEFISFITSEAAEKCQMEKRKTIGGEDILYAMITLGFENYAETLKIHLAKLRQVRAVVGCRCADVCAGRGSGSLQAHSTRRHRGTRATWKRLRTTDDAEEGIIEWTGHARVCIVFFLRNLRGLITALQLAVPHLHVPNMHPSS